MLIWGTAFKNILNLTRTQCPREVLPLVASAVGCKEEMAACFPCVQISPLAPWHPFSSGWDCCHWLLTVPNWVLLQEWPSAQEGCLAWGSPQLLLQRAENSAPLDSLRAGSLKGHASSKPPFGISWCLVCGCIVTQLLLWYNFTSLSPLQELILRANPINFLHADPCPRVWSPEHKLIHHVFASPSQAIPLDA